jgi:hypothetical protein
MSLFATTTAEPHQALTTPQDVPGNDPAPSPLPSTNEILSVFFPSDAGGVGYLFEHGVLDAAPVPLEDVPVATPDLGATAMSSVNEGVNAHVSPAPSIPDPGTGGELSLTTAEPTATPTAAPSTLKQTLATEGTRLKALIARLGGPVSGASNG